MTYILSNANVYSNGSFSRRDFSIPCDNGIDGTVSVDSSKYVIIPGFTDVHVHFREPGFSYKETIATGSRAAARGGYGTVCTMPNLSPVPDSYANLKQQLDLIERDGIINILPFGSITVGENGKCLSAFEELAPFVCGFSDDGRGVDDTALMREAMQRAKALGKIISAHCEDGSCVKDSPEAEWREIERDIKLADETGCKFHVCHISTKESVSLIRDAKASGVDITCETAPHYLLLTEDDALDDGRFRMNPPLRKLDDKNALVEGICDGTVDMIATDHAPHSAEEKSHGMKSLNGIVGLECAFPVMYTEFVKTGIITLEKLITLMSVAPNERFGIKSDSFSVFDLNDPFAVNPDEFATMGRSTPFDAKLVYGKNLLTFCNGNVVWKDKNSVFKNL